MKRGFLLLSGVIFSVGLTAMAQTGAPSPTATQGQAPKSKVVFDDDNFPRRSAPFSTESIRATGEDSGLAEGAAENAAVPVGAADNSDPSATESQEHSKAREEIEHLQAYLENVKATIEPTKADIANTPDRKTRDRLQERLINTEGEIKTTEQEIAGKQQQLKNIPFGSAPKTQE